MAEFNLPFGVRIANNDPIDYDRYIAADIAARNNLITEGRAYTGLQVFVESEEKLYILKDLGTSTWEEVGDGVISGPTSKLAAFKSGGGLYDSSILISYVAGSYIRMGPPGGISTSRDGLELHVSSAGGYTMPPGGSGGDLKLYSGSSWGTSGKGGSVSIYSGTGGPCGDISIGASSGLGDGLGGGSLYLSPGKGGAPSGIDGSLYILNIPEESKDKIIYYDETTKAISYGDNKSSNPLITEKTSAYTLTASDNNNVIEASGTFTLTLPDSVDAGFQITIVNSGTGTITLSATNLLTTDSLNQITSQYAGVSAVHKGSGTWYAWGNLS